MKIPIATTPNKYHDVWQSQVEIEHYSIDRITTFEAL